jgi:hypothetical protein
MFSENPRRVPEADRKPVASELVVFLKNLKNVQS